MGYLPRNDLQGGHLAFGKRAGFLVDHANRAELMSIRGINRRSSVEDDLQAAGHKRIVGKAFVLAGIFHDKVAFQGDRVGAKRNIPRGFGNRKSPAGFKPLAVAINKSNGSDGTSGNLYSQGDQFLKILLGQRIQYFIGIEILQPFFFIFLFSFLSPGRLSE